jgi:hypothetical protein
MAYGIWCEVSGGMMGYRAAWLKSETGERANFCTIEDAQSRADQLNADMNHAKAKASFRYTARATS